MLKHVFIIIGLLAVSLGTAGAHDGWGGSPEESDAIACKGSGLTGQSPGDKAKEFEQLLACAKRSVADAQARLDSLSRVEIDEALINLAAERDQLNGLVELRTTALSKVTADNTALASARDALAAELKKANGDNDEARARIQALQQEVERLAADLNAANAKNDEANGQIAALQAVIDQMTSKLDAVDADLKAAKGQLATLGAQVAALTAELAKARDEVKTEADALGAKIDALTLQLTDANARIEQLSAALTEASGKIATLSGQIDQLTADLKKQQAANADLTAALNAATAKIATLTTALCEATDKVVALTNRLDPYSQQFGTGLKSIFADNQNVFVDGNRVIVAAEVLFPTGSAELNTSGKDTVNKVADFMKAFAPKFPPDMKWVLQVNGHTDLRPIKTRTFPSNWELSTARALSVVKLLEASVPQGHLTAAGFSQYQPLAPGNDAEVMRHNRRIEMEITDNGLPGVAPPEPAPSSCAAKP